MSVHEALVAGRNLLEERGWVQYAFDGSGGYCAMGALTRGLRDRFDVDDRLTAVGVLAGLSGRPTVLSFNDAPGRTKAEVLALFDEAIRQTAPAPDLSFLNDRIAEREQNETFWTEVLS